MAIYQVEITKPYRKKCISYYKNKKIHRLNDRLCYMYDKCASYHLNDYWHRENNQLANYDNYNNKYNFKVK